MTIACTVPKDVAPRIRFVRQLVVPEQVTEDVVAAREVIAFQTGERTAFTSLYRRYFDRVYNHLAMTLRDRHEAEDSAQEVFVKAYRGLPRYELRPGVPFRSWLFRIVRNHAADHARQRQEAEATEPETLDRLRDNGLSQVDVHALEWLRDDHLVLLIERLPPAQRQVVMLRYMMDLSIKQIAEVLGRSPSAVAQLHHRATKFLEQRLRMAGRRGAGDHRPRASMRGPRRQITVVRERRFALLKR